jgi:TBC1 domain family protein 5
MTQVLDSTFVEHDAYILFDKLMTFGKSWYVFNDDVPSKRAPNARVKVNESYLYQLVVVY